MFTLIAICEALRQAHVTDVIGSAMTELHTKDGMEEQLRACNYRKCTSTCTYTITLCYMNITSKSNWQICRRAIRTVKNLDCPISGNNIRVQISTDAKTESTTASVVNTAVAPNIGIRIRADTQPEPGTETQKFPISPQQTSTVL